MIMLSIVFPILWGMVILLNPEIKTRNVLILTTGVGLVISAIFTSIIILTEGTQELYLCSLGKNMDIFFCADTVGKLFAAIVMVVWVLAGFFAFEYMKHENEEKRYFACYLVVYGVLNALCFSGSMVTYYLFYETMTLLSVLLVLHSRTKEAIMGGLKYLFYSIFGAYLVLFGIFFCNRYTTTLNFTAGGTLDMAAVAGNEGILLAAVFCIVLGFGVKGGIFPLHAWLPTAHPVAPAPASAVMSAIIVKMGVLGALRGVYFIVGPDFIRGTWVQTVWLALSVFTVFLGSMLAYREKNFKKRLAYSTVSQISYIFFGMAVLQPQGLLGSLLHVIFHAVIKATLFLCAGAIIYQTGKTSVTQLRGIGKKMPLTMWAYTFASFALVGIPPASGFISKWYLGIGALKSEISFFAWFGPAVLLISALLTAGYLIPITIQGFLPGEEFSNCELEMCEPKSVMLVPVMILGTLSLVLGIVPNLLIDVISNIVSTVF